MAYVIAGSCVRDDVCTQACPVDCIHPVPGEPDFDTAEQLYIDPGECIDCDACVEVCPVSAISGPHDLLARWRSSAEVNSAFFLGR